MGKIFLVGMGPGDASHMTPAADEALKAADVICGYTGYLALLKDRYPGKDTFSTPMTREMERCEWAVEAAAAGKTVAMLCSGDSGVYGMAGPVIEKALGTGVEIEVVPGITAAVSGAALLGAPLMNDFCVISLSDLMTPWETIERRLRCAAQGDFAVALYNPRSHRRRDHLKKACGILMEYKSPETVCGWVRNIGRDGQEAHLTTLKELADADLDMFCTVFVGTAGTKAADGFMVTPRGYEEKK